MLINYITFNKTKKTTTKKKHYLLIIILIFLFKAVQNPINETNTLYKICFRLSTYMVTTTKTTKLKNIKITNSSISTAITGIKKNLQKIMLIKKHNKYKNIRIKPRNLNPKWSLLKNLIKKQKNKKNINPSTFNKKIKINITPQILKNYFVYKIRRKKDIYQWHRQQKMQIYDLFINFKKNTTGHTLFPNARIAIILSKLLRNYNKQKRKSYFTNPKKFKITTLVKNIFTKFTKVKFYKNHFFVKTENNVLNIPHILNFSKQFTLILKHIKYHSFLEYTKTKKMCIVVNKHTMNKIELKNLLLSDLFNFSNTNLQINDFNVTNYLKNNTTTNLSHMVLTKFTDKIGQNIQHAIKSNNTNETLWKDKLSLFYTHKKKQIITVNNYLPLMYTIIYSQTTKYKLSNSKLYFSKIGSLKSLKYKNFFIFFLLNFLEKFIQKKLWLRLCAEDFFSLESKKRIDIFVLKHFGIYRRFARLIPIRELMEIITIMSITRDLQIFLYFIKSCFEKNHFKKHKKILSILFDVIRKNKTIFYENGVRGFFFDIRGKVGVSGNAKKRHLSFSLGKITTTSQNIRSYWQQINVWTPTGQMGITCYILY